MNSSDHHEKAMDEMASSVTNLSISKTTDDTSEVQSLWSEASATGSVQGVSVGQISIEPEKSLDKLQVTAPIGITFVPHTSFSSNALPRWAKISDVQTVLGSLYKSRKISSVKYQRVQVDLPDGDFVDLDLAVNILAGKTFKGSTWDGMDGKPIVLLVHGLGGNSGSSYMSLAARELAKQGIRSVALNMRGSSGRPNRRMQLYHACAYQDVEFVLNWLMEKYRVPMGVMGFSLGGCITLNLMGRRAQHLPDFLVAAATISPPLDLLTGSQLIQKGPGKKWTGYLMAGLRVLLKPRLDDLRTGFDGQFVVPEGFDVDKAYNAKTISDFDKYFVAPLHGYKSVDDYYTRACPIPYLEEIDRPTLIIRARDDPFLAPNDVHVSALRSNEYIEAILTEKGGHIGFMARDKDSFWPWRLQCFAEPTAAQFFADKFADWYVRRDLGILQASRKPRVASVGSVNVDLYYEIPRLPLAGETMSAKNFTMRVGGKGANQAVAASRIIDNVSLIACVGTDSFGERSLSELRAWGLDTSRVEKRGTTTGSAVILLQESGENSILIVPGANALMDVQMVNQLDFDVVLLQLECPFEVNLQVMKLCRTVFNPSPLPEDLTIVREMVRLCTCLIVNEGELNRLVLGEGSLFEKLEKVLAMSRMELVIVTLGHKGGVCLMRSVGFIEFAGVQANVVDSTGAGDCFLGTFGALWAHTFQDQVSKEKMKCILDACNAIAAMSVEMRGTMDSYACRRAFASGRPQDRCDAVERIIKDYCAEMDSR